MNPVFFLWYLPSEQTKRTLAAKDWDGWVIAALGMIGGDVGKV